MVSLCSKYFRLDQIFFCPKSVHTHTHTLIFKTKLIKNAFQKTKMHKILIFTNFIKFFDVYFFYIYHF